MHYVQAVMVTPEGAIGLYLVIGVLILLAGWVADTALGSRRSD